MRRRHALRQARLAQAAVGATIIAVPSSAAALAEAATTSQPAADAQAVNANVHAHRIRFGRELVVTGDAPAAERGQRVDLRYSQGGSPVWRVVDSAIVGHDGRFRLAARLRRSGTITVTGAWQQPTAPDVGGAAASDVPPGARQRVTVTARLHLRRHELEAFGGGTIHVLGRLMPGTHGRRVRLQALEHGHWHTISSARTGGRGGFDLRFVAGANEPLRVLFAGDHLNGRAHQRAGTVTVFHQSVASWYNDGGSTACGFHAYYGVANRSLPCGTHVKFDYGGRTVTATVDDRGPFVAGRDWDLNQNTAGALGFGGVGSVWTSQ